jgi:hypothetical protein
MFIDLSRGTPSGLGGQPVHVINGVSDSRAGENEVSARFSDASRPLEEQADRRPKICGGGA